MPEIMKRGELPEERKYQGECEYCRSEIRFSHSEVRELYDQQREGSTQYVGCCPVCGHSMFPTPVKGIVNGLLLLARSGLSL